jgi:hypothetical protein
MATAAAADKDAAAFDAPQIATIRGYLDDAMEPFLSRDGAILFCNNLNEPSVNTDIHYAVRIDPLTFKYKGRVGNVNTSALEGVPTMDKDGNFYFISPRDYDKSARRFSRGSSDETMVFSQGRRHRLQPSLPYCYPDRWHARSSAARERNQEGV